MSTEESFNVTLKLIHSDGIISGARILKARSKLPEDILDTINKLFQIYESLTPEDIKLAAGRYFVENNRTIVTLTAKK